MNYLRAVLLVVILVLVAALSMGLQLPFLLSSRAADPPEPGTLPAEEPTHPLTEQTDPPTEQTEPPEPEPEPAPEPKPHRVALTFDDGPTDKVTPALLDGLKERGVAVTFFILGSRIKGREHILARAAEEGHQIANHSYSHSNFTKLTAAEIVREINDTADLTEAACGQRTWLVRPPYGAVNKIVKEAVSEPFILWSVDPEDWRLRNAQAVFDAVMATVEDGDIILLHDAYETSAEAAFLIIDTLGAMGYDFVTVEALYAESGITLEGGRSYFSAPARTREEPAAPEPTECRPTVPADQPESDTRPEDARASVLTAAA